MLIFEQLLIELRIVCTMPFVGDWLGYFMHGNNSNNNCSNTKKILICIIKGGYNKKANNVLVVWIVAI